MLDSLIDVEPYDIYSTLTVKNSVPAEHVKEISDALIRVMIDDNYPDRLCVSQPPRTAKSSLITLSFPFWLILMNPELNIIIVNNTQTLADNFGLRLRQLFIDNKNILAERDIYLSDKRHARATFVFENKKGELLGSIKLMGSMGTITGQDVDVLIIDDLIKGYLDCTPTQLRKLNDYYDTILVQRLEPHSKLIMLGTRWNTQDVFGRLKEQQPDKYEFIEIKALNDDGTCIWNNRYTPEFFEERRREIGERLFQSLYQQEPLDETGDFFNIDNLFYEKPDTLITGMVRSWDFAYSDETKGEVHDYTAGILMYRTIDDRYIVKGLEHGQYGDNLINIVKQTAKADSPRVKILIETGTVGGAAEFLFKEYKQKLTGYNVEQSKPIGAKVDRATPLKNAILDGKVGIVVGDENRGKILEQLKGFPLSARDDIVDAMSYAYNELQKMTGDTIRTGNKRRRRSLR